MVVVGGSLIIVTQRSPSGPRQVPYGYLRDVRISPVRGLIKVKSAPPSKEGQISIAPTGSNARLAPFIPQFTGLPQSLVPVLASNAARLWAGAALSPPSPSITMMEP